MNVYKLFKFQNEDPYVHVEHYDSLYSGVVADCASTTNPPYICMTKFSINYQDNTFMAAQMLLYNAAGIPNNELT